jgi:hypothetical protein
MTRLVVLLTVLASLVATGVATANSRTVVDPRNDPKGSHYPGSAFYWQTDGPCAGQWTTVETNECGDMAYSENQGGLMDIAKATHGHARGGLIVHRVAMHRTWRNALLGRGAQISIYVTTDADAAFERRIDVGLKRGKPVFVVRNSRGGLVGRGGAATRPNTKTVQVAFARRLLGSGVRHYRWFAFAGVACKRAYNACGDRSPGASLVTHHLG